MALRRCSVVRRDLREAPATAAVTVLSNGETWLRWSILDLTVGDPLELINVEGSIEGCVDDGRAYSVSGGVL